MKPKALHGLFCHVCRWSLSGLGSTMDGAEMSVLWRCQKDHFPPPEQAIQVKAPGSIR